MQRVSEATIVCVKILQRVVPHRLLAKDQPVESSKLLVE